MTTKKRHKTPKLIDKHLSSSSLTSSQIYDKEINDMPLLTSEQEVELASKIQAGDIKARNKLVEHNLKLVRSVARRYAIKKGLTRSEFEDIQQYGVIGCMKAAERFDPLNNLTPEGEPPRFVTSAYYWINAEIDRAVNSPSEGMRNDKHISFWFQELVKRMPSFKKQFEDEQGYAPDREKLINYIHDKFKHRKSRIKAALDFEDMGNKSLDYVPPDSDESLLGSISGSEHLDPVSTNFDNGNKFSLLESYIEKLPSRYQIVWKLRFGLFDEGLLKKYGFDNEKLKLLMTSGSRKHRLNSDTLPSEVIGEILGLTQQACDQRYRNGLQIMRAYLVKDPAFAEHRQSLEKILLKEISEGNPKSKSSKLARQLFLGEVKKKDYKNRRETPLARFGDLEDSISFLPDDKDRELVRLFYQVDSEPLLAKYNLESNRGGVSLNRIASALKMPRNNALNHLNKSEEIIEYLHLGIPVDNLESMRVKVISKYVDIARQALGSIEDELGKKILSLKYGLEDGVPHTQTEIAQILGINRNNSRNIYDSTYRNLWKNMKPLLEKEFFK